MDQGGVRDNRQMRLDGGRSISGIGRPRHSHS